MKTGINRYGWITIRMQKTVIVLNTPCAAKLDKAGICKSSTLISFENRANIRPTGLESKNNILDLATCVSILSWIFYDALHMI